MDNKQSKIVEWINDIVLKYFFGYFNSNMNNKKFNRLDWTNIFILKNFQDYFNLKDLQSLSMLSKFTRIKLNPIIFNSTRLIKYTHRGRGDKPIRVFNIKSFEMLSRIAVRDEDEIEKSLYIKKSLSDINSELQGIKNFVKSIYICNVKRPGYYLYPVLANFTNLSILKIHCSTIQYSIFQKLGEYFPMLKTFELYRVILSKKSTSSNNSNEIVFPINLSYLSIRCVEVTDIAILDEPYMTVYGYDFDPRSKFVLPNIHLPSLKSLQFLRCSAKETGLEEFLQTNPNLEQLSIDTFGQGTSKYFNCLKSLHVDQLENINNLENLIAYQNIKILKVSIAHNVYYDKFEKLCLMCPSVEFLHFNIVDSENLQEAFNTYLTPILKKLPNLKIIELPLYEIYNELIDINHFSTIEKIIFETENISHLSVYFKKSRNLKEIEFRATYEDIDKEGFLEKYKSYSDWKFEFFNQKVKGYKINNSN
jgi:hypothetical protein